MAKSIMSTKEYADRLSIMSPDLELKRIGGFI
jgi:hypothetical protein